MGSSALVLFLIGLGVIIVAAIAQWFAKNALAVTGVIFIILLLISMFLSKTLAQPWPVFGVFAVLYYLLSYIGTLIGTLAYRGYDKIRKNKKN